MGLSSYVDRAKNFACARFFSPQNDGMFAEILDIHCIHRPYTRKRALSPAPAPSAYWHDQPSAYWYDQPSAYKQSLVKISQDFRPDLSFRSLT